MNIAEPIFLHCRSKPAEVALAAPGTAFNVVSYARLERMVNSVCLRALAAGLAAGNKVAVFVDDPVFHAIVLIALTRLGVVTISGRTRDFSWRFAIDAVIADKPFPFLTQRVILASPDWMKGDDRPLNSQHIYRAAPDDPCRIFLTSGTTGNEKAVAVTHRMMATRINLHDLFFGPRAPFCARTYLDIALSTSLGFQVLFATLWRGGALFLPGEAQATVSALPIYKVQNMVASPRGLLELVEAVDKRPEYQCGLEAVFSGGSILSDALGERVRARICSNVTKAYGSTEAGEVASMPSHFAKGVAGAVGYVMPGIDVEIVDDGGHVLPTGEEGIVRIRSDLGPREYLGDTEETRRVFRDGWFHPGDLGYLTQDNMLVIAGRATSVINVGGEKVNAERIEGILAGHTIVAQVAVLPVPSDTGLDELCALVVPRSDMNAETLRDYCKARLPSAFVPAQFIAVTSLPRNEWGKLDRTKLPELLKRKLS
jgi:acyl-CoA synthetase (AMP-forming)/AMP-acid ligase II